MVFSPGSDGAGELERDDAAGVGDDQVRRSQGRELRHGRGRVNRGLAEHGQGGVDLDEELQAGERAALAEAGARELLGGGDIPGVLLRRR